MKNFVCIALVVILGIVAVQGYGPKGSHKSSHQRPQHHGPPQRPHHRPPHGNGFGPPNQHGNWDNSPVWDRSDSSGSSESSGGYDSYDPDYSYGPDYSHNRDYSSSEPSYEEYDDWHNHHHSKHPYKPPHYKKPPKPTRKPIRTTLKPVPTTHRNPITRSTLPPRPHTRCTPKTTGTAAVRPNPTTPQTVPIPPNTTASKVTGTTWHPTTPTIDTTHWVITTNDFPDTTTPKPEIKTTTAKQEGVTTTSPEIQKCIDSCLSTPEYNPVCGSNGVTYQNEGKLFCATSCGVKVTLKRRSACPPPNNGGVTPDILSTTTTTTTTTPATTPSRGRTTPISDFQRCMKVCRITGSFTPVCGTDLVTYMNMDRLKCAQSCGEVVEVLCEKPCAACGFNPVTPKTTTTASTTTPQIGRSTLEPDLQECINGCPITPEYNPVCGSDHVTYSNPSHFVCAQLCGVGITVSRLGPCGPTTTSSTTTVAPVPTLSPNVLNCIRSCPITTEYDPVCGSDDHTYNNLGILHCSKFCGVEVELKHKSKCVGEFDLGPDEFDSTTSQTTLNMNGNKDPVTTSSRSTATTALLFTSPITITTTEANTIPSTVSTATNEDSTSSSTLGFTIPNDVLVDIFGSTTSKPTNPDEDEDIDLDARFNNETDTENESHR